MNIKYVGVLLLVFAVAISAVSASENITNEDNVLAVEEEVNDLSISYENNVTVASEDSLAVFSENVNVTDGPLAVSSENITLATEDSDSLAVSSDNVTLSVVNEIPVAVSIETELTAQNNETKLSVPVEPEPVLSSIYDKVYSKKMWKTVWICSLSLKYTWSSKKMKQVANKKTKAMKKKVYSKIKTNMKKGWKYNRVYYTTSYGRTKAVCRYYLQFYRTVYYNGYGKVLYVD